MSNKIDAQEAIVWIDIETTGLDYKKEALLEIAVLITNNELEVIDSYSNIIKTPKRKLRRMDDYVRKMHTDSELLADLKHFGGKPIAEVEAEILEMLDRHGLEKRLLLAGNSVGFDRRMLETRMPKLMARFGYQNLDVTSIGKLVQRWTPAVDSHIRRLKENDPNPFPHRAWYDILDSVEQLKSYRKLVFTDESEQYLVTTKGV